MNLAKLTDKQRKQIIADRADGMSLRKLAAKFNVSDATIRRTLANNPEAAQKVAEKKEQNTQDILAYMESKRDVVCEIIGKGLSVLNSDEKLHEASPAQITTALGTLIDKWAMISGGSPDESKDDDLSRSLKEMAEELESDV